VSASTYIELDRIWKMLDACLPGWYLRTTDHRHRIFCTGRPIYPGLPVGEHGHRRNAEIKGGHVRNMARHFNIEDCAKEAIPEAFG
jgi:hypothetical protein